MKRIVIPVKIIWLSAVVEGYKGAVSKKGKLTGEVAIRGYAGMLLDLISPWRKTPQGVLAHRQAFVEKIEKKLSDLEVELSKPKRTKN